MPSFANGRGIVHAGSNGKSIVMPDVCLTPTPGGPVPIPYVNAGCSSDTSEGPTSVTIEGNMPMVKGAKYCKSSGDAAGVVGGVTSGTSQGVCEFKSYSFDVKIEGRNVCRLGDSLFHNGRNTSGGVEAGEPTAAPPPPAKPLAPAKAKFIGIIKGPAGPLKNWPFLLKRNGTPVDQSSLGGRTANAHRNGAWVSGQNGEFRFEEMPEGYYAIEVLLPAGELVVNEEAPPPAESGRRAPTPPFVDQYAFLEDPGL